MFSEQSVVLHSKGFRYRKDNFIVKELAITTLDHSDSQNFLPPVLFSSLLKLEQKVCNWLTKTLHGVHWESGKNLYLNLNQTVQNFNLRNPNAVFYIKGKENIELLAKYLDQKLKILMIWIARDFKTYISRIIHLAIDNYIITTPGNTAPRKKKQVLL